MFSRTNSISPPNKPENKPLVESDSDLEPNSYSLQKFKLYETRARFYLVGRDESQLRWRVLKIDRSECTTLNIYEDPAIYTKQDCCELLNRLAEGNRSSGGFNFVTKAYGIVGFVKFLEPHYMILVTKRRRVGRICGHSIYGIDESQLLTLQHSSVQSELASSTAEFRYKKLFCSIDLTKDFFFSYSYRFMWTLQRNSYMGEAEKMPYDDMFVWNAFLTRGIRQQVRSLQWTVALIHGFFKQAELCAGENMKIVVTLIARRSRHFAGTRYLKRGVNGKGRVANDVETEQIVFQEACGNSDEISSVVQHRGSIPLFWSQETSILSPKPDIKLHKNDPKYEATKLHFQNLAGRYGNPIIVLNLVKTHERRARETILSREFGNAVAYLNHSLLKEKRINYVGCDVHLFAKRTPTNVVQVLASIANDVIDMTGFYCCTKVVDNSLMAEDSCDLNSNEGKSRNNYEKKIVFQKGVLRSNCIDCIDRTNVAQYAFGLVALGRQMFSLGLSQSPRINPDSKLSVALMETYENMGDSLGIQYGGSAAHNKVFSQKLGKWKATAQSQSFLRSVTRHYNNAYLDGEKQDAINIFLGHFRPESWKLPLWQLDSDHHLQFRRVGEDPLNDCRLSFKKSFSVGNMVEQMKPGDFARDSHSFLSALPGILAAESIPTLENNTCTENNLKHIKSNNGLINDISEFETAKDFNSYSAPELLNGSSDVQRMIDIAENDWSSSAGNSCEEDASERQMDGN